MFSSVLAVNLPLAQAAAMASALSVSGCDGWRTQHSQEDLPHIRGRGSSRVPGCDGTGIAKRSHPASEVRGCGREEPPGVRGQGQWSGGATLRMRPGTAARKINQRPRSSGCAGTGGPRGAIPRCRSERAAVRRYPSSKVRSSGCALLEQL